MKVNMKLKKKRRLAALLFTVVMAVCLIPNAAFAETANIMKVQLTYDKAAISFNTSSKEGEVDSKLRENVSTTTEGVRIDRDRSGLNKKIGTGWWSIGDGTSMITTATKYGVQFIIQPDSGYDWIDKENDTVINFYLNGTLTTPDVITYNSSLNSYRVVFSIGYADKSITVTNDGNGIASASNSAAPTGETVTLTVTPNSGYHFKAWEKTPASLEIMSDNTFIMPAESVTVKAVFEADTVTSPSGGGGGIVLPPALPADELKEAKDAATAHIADMLKAQTFSGDEQKKADEIKTSFEDKLTKLELVEEVKKLQEETAAAIDILWSDEEINLKSKVEAIGRTELIAKSKVVRTKSGAKAVRVSWNKVEGLDFDGYEIYRSTSRTKFGKTPIKTADGDKTSYLNTKNLRKGKTYYYKLKAFKIVNGEKVYTGFSTRTWKTPKK